MGDAGSLRVATNFSRIPLLFPPTFLLVTVVYSSSPLPVLLTLDCRTSSFPKSFAIISLKVLFCLQYLSATSSSSWLAWSNKSASKSSARLENFSMSLTNFSLASSDASIAFKFTLPVLNDSRNRLVTSNISPKVSYLIPSSGCSPAGEESKNVCNASSASSSACRDIALDFLEYLSNKSQTSAWMELVGFSTVSFSSSLRRTSMNVI